MDIISAIRDPRLFRDFLGEDLTTWRPWQIALRALYGLPITLPKNQELVRLCTGRDPAKLPATGFNTALLLTGRRSGKSRIAALIGAFEGILAGHEKKLAKGERGLVPIICPSKSQGRIIKGYLRALCETPLLAAEVIDEQRDGFTLRSGTRIEILAGDYRSVRGYLQAKPDYYLALASSSGEIQALKSTSKKYIATIVDAVNEAIVRYH